jgi:hypothetical protein
MVDTMNAFNADKCSDNGGNADKCSDNGGWDPQLNFEADQNGQL